MTMFISFEEEHKQMQVKLNTIPEYSTVFGTTAEHDKRSLHPLSMLIISITVAAIVTLYCFVWLRPRTCSIYYLKYEDPFVLIDIFSSQSQSDSSEFTSSSSSTTVSVEFVKLVKLLFDCIESDGENLSVIQLPLGRNSSVRTAGYS